MDEHQTSDRYVKELELDNALLRFKEIMSKDIRESTDTQTDKIQRTIREEREVQEKTMRSFDRRLTAMETKLNNLILKASVIVVVASTISSIIAVIFKNFTQ